jgi:hypothetical protein
MHSSTTKICLPPTNRQLWENYTRKSGDGLSMTFLVIWLAGDVFNLLGVIMQDLLVTMVKIKALEKKKS